MSQSQYPEAYDVFTAKRDGVDYLMADYLNALSASVVAIQRTLGISPEGTSDTVAGRFTSLSNSDHNTDWVAYTPDIYGGTIASSNLFWRRQGNQIEIRGTIKQTGASTAPIAFTMPGTYTANLSKLPTSITCFKRVSGEFQVTSGFIPISGVASITKPYTTTELAELGLDDSEEAYIFDEPSNETNVGQNSRTVPMFVKNNYVVMFNNFFDTSALFVITNCTIPVVV